MLLDPYSGASTADSKPSILPLGSRNQVNRPNCLLRFQGKPRSAMSSTAILSEAKQLHDVGDRLDLLAELHPLISEALLAISGNIRQTAALLELLVATKMRPVIGFKPENS
jgi:hypothetical protein